MSIPYVQPCTRVFSALRFHFLLLVLAVILCWISFPITAHAQYWTQKADFGGTPRAFAVGFSANGSGYIGTGGTQWSSQDFYRYDVPSNTWAPSDSFPVATNDGVVFVIDGKGYSGSGWGAPLQFWAFDPATNDWNSVANFPGTGLEDQVAFSINGKGYVGTGWMGAACSNEFWEYDPAANTWTQKANVPGVPRNYAAAFALGGKGYVGTGSSNSGGQNDFWRYDPAADTWTQIADFPGMARCYASTFTIGGLAYVGTGSGAGSANSNLSDFWEYNPATDAWTQIADIPQGRNKAVGFSINDKGYVGTGRVGQTGLNDFWEYSPKPGSAAVSEMISQNVSVTVFPNPFLGALNITVANESLSEVILYDLLSRKVLQRTFTGTTTLDTGHLGAGVYVYTVRNGSEIIQKGKVIKR